jgi:RHS repeat-associated protein
LTDENGDVVYENDIDPQTSYTLLDTIDTSDLDIGDYTLTIDITDKEGIKYVRDTEITITANSNIQADITLVTVEGSDIKINGIAKADVEATYVLKYRLNDNEWRTISEGEATVEGGLLGTLPLANIVGDTFYLSLQVTTVTGKQVIVDKTCTITTTTPPPTPTPTSTPTPIPTDEPTPTPVVTGDPTPMPTTAPTATPTVIPGDFTDDQLFVDIKDDQDGKEVTYITDIIGTVSGSLLNTYIFEVYPTNSDVAVYTKAGTDPITDAAVGTLDPTLLMNGYYQVKLTAYTANGQGLYDEITVLVTGVAKIGNFSISFNDLTTGVNNFPIDVYRTYDSRQKNQIGDFGYGWTMSVGGPSISVTNDLGAGWTQLSRKILGIIPQYYWFPEYAHEINIDWGNGASETFALKLSPETSNAAMMEFGISAYCESKTGNSKLEILDPHEDLIYASDGRLYSFEFTYDEFAPQNFLLTKIDGTKYYFNVNTGLYKIEDTYGQTITITDHGIVYSDGTGIEFVRDSAGRITSISDGVQSVTYTYDANGDLVSVLDRAGEKTNFVYSNHYLEEIIDARGIRVAKNIYDEQGRLVSSIDADGNEIKFEHDLDAKREVVTNRLGYSTIYEYDDFGNVISVTDALGRTTYKTYDGNHNLSSETDAIGNTTYYSYSADGNLLSMTNRCGVVKVCSYNSDGSLTSINYDGSTIMELTYNRFGNIEGSRDKTGNLASFEYYSNGNLKSITDSIGMLYSCVYDGDGRVVSMTSADGMVVSYTYDSNGQIATKTITTGSYSLTTSYTYDMYGNLIKLSEPDGSFYIYAYDSAGNKLSAEDAQGNKTTYSYDLRGNCTGISYPDGTSETFTYDAENQMISATDRLGVTVTYSYDKVGNLVSVRESTGATEVYTYDDNDRLISLTNSLGGTTLYGYDEEGRNTSVTDAFGNTTHYSYSSENLLTKLIDAEGNEYLYEYDNGGNITKTIYPDGNTITKTYDVRGRLLSETDVEGNTTTYSYDLMDRLVSVTDTKGSTWNYEYDGIGNVTKITDALGNETHYSYDQFGHLVKTKNAKGDEATLSYDSQGNVTKETDFGGKTTTYTYDSLGRVTSVVDGDGTTTYSYNSKGQLVSVQSSSGTITYSYNAQGYLTSKTDEFGETVNYVYDASGCLTGISCANGSVGYTYDVAGRLTSVTDADGNTTIYSYDNIGNLVSTEYSNGVTATYEYNAGNHLTKIEYEKSDGTILASYEYTLGSKGEKLSCQELDRKVTYTYDELDRLTSETVEKNGTTSVTSYTYDANSNRSTMTKDGVVTNYIYNELNQLIQAGSVVYTYDNAGNLVAQSDNGALVASYEYNARNQMVKAIVNTVSGTLTETYTYNYLGDRTSKTSNGVTTYYTLDYSTGLSQNLCNKTGSEAVFFARGLDLISGTSSSNTYYYLFDGNSNVRAITDLSGSISDEYIFDAFGNELSHSGSSANEYGFKGEQQDDTGLYYLRARYMDPTTGVFTSMDTYSGVLNDPTSLHKYLYANSNPVSNCDPTGHYTLAEECCIMACMGALCGALYYSLDWMINDPTSERHSILGMINTILFCAIVAVLIVLVIEFIAYIYTAIVSLITAGSQYSDRFLAWLNKGASNNSVYFGRTASGDYVYTGITRQSIAARLAQHISSGKPFVALDEVVSGLTRNQARAIEQYFIENGPNLYNQINSISPNSQYYEEAERWAIEFLKSLGIL